MCNIFLRLMTILSVRISPHFTMRDRHNCNNIRKTKMTLGNFGLPENKTLRKNLYQQKQAATDALLVLFSVKFYELFFAKRNILNNRVTFRTICRFGLCSFEIGYYLLMNSNSGNIPNIQQRFCTHSNVLVWKLLNVFVVYITNSIQSQIVRIRQEQYELVVVCAAFSCTVRIKINNFNSNKVDQLLVVIKMLHDNRWLF